MLIRLVLVIGTSVLLLLFRGSPSAIIGFVVPEGVEAVNRSPILPLTHVSEKITEARPPPGTDFNPLGTVISIRLMLGILTPGEHIFPGPVRGLPPLVV
jgi:hypothetical protein